MAKNDKHSVFFQYITERTNRTQIAHYLLLFMLAMSMLIWGNIYVGILILVFLLVLIIINPMPPSLISTILILIILFYSPVLDTLSSIKSINLESINQLERVTKKTFSPDTGKQVYSKQVTEGLNLLKGFDGDSIQLSKGYRQSENEIFIRTVESIWPIRVDELSPYILIMQNEMDQYSYCQMIKRGKVAAFVHCD